MLVRITSSLKEEDVPTLNKMLDELFVSVYTKDGNFLGVTYKIAHPEIVNYSMFEFLPSGYYIVQMDGELMAFDQTSVANFGLEKLCNV